MQDLAFDATMQALLDCMVITMASNPEQALRNAAYHVMDALLEALPVHHILLAAMLYNSLTVSNVCGGFYDNIVPHSLW